MCRVNPLIIILFSLFFIFSARAQESKKTVPLRNILQGITSEHHIRFSYIDEEIAAVSVVPPPQSMPLERKLADLGRQTGFHFTLIAGICTIFDDNKKTRICGYAIDPETGLPIENATITSGAFSTTSNAKGYFELLRSSDSVAISHIGYQVLLIHSPYLAGDCRTIALSPVPIILKEITTRRFLATGISKKTDGSFEVRPGKFGVLPGLIEPDVLETMQQLPGIYSPDEAVSNISVRGGTHDQNLFLWNGIRMFQTGHFFGLLSAFDTALPQTISIRKNGAPAMFGESVSGIVNISSNPGIGSNKFSVGSNMISAEGYARLTLSPKAGLEISGRRSLTDFFDSPTYRKYSNRIFQNTVVTNLASNQSVQYNTDKSFYFYDLTLRYHQKIGNRHTFSINAIGVRNKLDVRRSTASETQNSDLGQENFGGALHWETQFNEYTTLNAQAYISRYRLDASNKTPGSSQVLTQQNKVLDDGFRIHLNHRVNEIVSLTAGWQYDEASVTSFDEINIPFFSRNIERLLHTQAFIAQSTFQWPASRTLVAAGIRGNQYRELDKFLPELRIQVNQGLGKSFRMEVLSEQKSQTFSQVIDLQDDFLGIEKRRWTLANNADIPIMKSNQVSAEIIYSSNAWLATLGGFYKEVEGITTASQGFQNQYELLKASGSYRVRGIEALMQKNFGRFYTWLSYCYNDNVYSFPTLTFNAFPNNYELRHVITYAGIYEWNRLKIALGGKWHTGRPVTDPASGAVSAIGANALQITYNTPNSSRLPDFFQLNFSSIKTWNLSKTTDFQAGVSVLNILDRRNVINRFYRVNSTDDSIERVNTYALGATPNVSVKVIF